MLEHVQKTLDELKEHRAGIVLYIENIDNAIGVLEKMTDVCAESERLLKGGEEKPDNPPATRTKKGLPKGIVQMKYKGKPGKFRATYWDGAVKKHKRVGLFDTVDEAVAAIEKAVSKVGVSSKAAKSAENPSAGAPTGEYFVCQGCKKEYTPKNKPAFCDVCGHRTFDGPFKSGDRK